MALTLDTNSLMQMSLFEKITRSKVKDCFDFSSKTLAFVVLPGQLKKAIGPKGANVKKLENLFKKKIKIIEFNPKIEKFIENLCHPNKVSKVHFTEQMLWNSTKREITIIPEDLKSRGFIIGKDASNLRQMEEITRRYFKIDEIRVGGEKPQEEGSKELEEKLLKELEEENINNEETLEDVFDESANNNSLEKNNHKENEEKDKKEKTINNDLTKEEKETPKN